MAGFDVLRRRSAAPPAPIEKADPVLLEQVNAEVEALKRLGLHDLRRRRRDLFRAQAPEHLPRYLLVRILAYQVQANAFGDLDRETARYLDRVARDYVRRRDAGRQGRGRSRRRSRPSPMASR